MINWDTKPYSKEVFIEAWNSSISIAEVIRKLGYKNSGGGSYHTIQKAALELGLTKDHMLGQAHLKGRTNHWVKRTPIEDLLVKGKFASHLRQRLIKEGILDAKCSKCGITEWNGIPAPLELDHMDGDNTNNLLENLRILCCNCHAQTGNYKGRNAKLRKKPIEKLICSNCGGKKSSSRSKHCWNCSLEYRPRRSKPTKPSPPKISNLRPAKINWPEISYLESRSKEIGFLALGRELGVSDNAIRKHLKKFDHTT